MSSKQQRPDMAPRRPSAELPAGADEFVRTGTATAPAAATSTPTPPQREPTRRLTLDLPERLHRRMKIRSATTGVPMVDEVRAVLEAHYGSDG
ncbi:hypothetical protein [Mycobacterium xenopi]|uniref:hypothetical protein n=1 Tax=Mycobacterium xenopi TaxID=1789 RepID=UPI000D9DCA11|nr:hypothetical protein [Mycobacterium xenopi]SPX88471.1 Uncharacterised protein [Mycobacterium xenopi]